MTSVSLVLLFWLTVVGGIVMKKHVPGRTRDDNDGATSRTVNRAGNTAAGREVARNSSAEVATPSGTVAMLKDLLEKHGHVNKTVFSDNYRLIHLVSLDNIQQDFTQGVFKACLGAGTCVLDGQLGRLYGDLRNHSLPIETAAATLYNQLVSYQPTAAMSQVAATTVPASPVLRITATTEAGGHASEALLTLAAIAEQSHSDLRLLVLVKSQEELLQAAAAHMFNLRSEATMAGVVEERGYLEELTLLASHLSRLDRRFFRCYRTKTLSNLSPLATQDLHTFVYPPSLPRSHGVREVVGVTAGVVSVHPSTTKLSETARNKITTVAKKLDGLCQ